MDTLSVQARSENMRRIRSENSGPELELRSLLHKRGYRFRLHRKDLPGAPDIVFPKLHKVIFVHGCFWHQHQACREGRMPGSRQDYWKPKLERNLRRDADAQAALHLCGWEFLVIWECELNRDKVAVLHRAEHFLSS